MKNKPTLAIATIGVIIAKEITIEEIPLIASLISFKLGQNVRKSYYQK
jgi:hypothetical protein